MICSTCLKPSEEGKTIEGFFFCPKCYPKPYPRPCDKCHKEIPFGECCSGGQSVWCRECWEKYYPEDGYKGEIKVRHASAKPKVKVTSKDIESLKAEIAKLESECK